METSNIAPRFRTTSYHPMSNGLVERFHRHLKAAIMAQPDPTNWTECLPLVLLGIRSALKKDLGCTPAELVYGSTLRLPGGFLNSVASTELLADPADYVNTLRCAMHRLRAIPTRTPNHSHQFTSFPAWTLPLTFFLSS